MSEQTEPTFQPGALDAYGPEQMAQRVLNVGVKKAHLDFLTTFALSVLAGAFIALGAICATVVMTDSSAGFGITRLLGGLAFSLGLILVVVAGAELFTGNSLIVIAWVSGNVGFFRLLRNWIIVYIGNLVGAIATAGLLYLSSQYSFQGYDVAETALRIANLKVNLGFQQALALGILCNALVCLAVWLCFSARTTTDKILSILFPISAFVASGFEHSVANMYFIPIGIFIMSDPTALTASGIPVQTLANLNWEGFLNNLLPVTLGNIIGGGILVALVYWFVYLRKAPPTSA
jgi:formate/nitrite transporter